ncbi:FAD:protein FMN transferase [Clostridium sediminicola]|uniref:FAD:protein FMN transferase n=1 Tax=Clostridium sediminicola TaxID=3114879 RepID=UPI0031F2318D
MKNKKLVIFIIFFAIIISLTIVFFKVKPQATSEENTPKEKSNYFLGTYISIKLYDKSSDDMFTDMFNILNDIEEKMSINIEESEVSKINKNAGKSPVMVSHETFEVIKRGEYYSNLSEGNFDITIGPLVQLWGIGSESAKVPSQKEIDKATSKIDYTKILIDEEKQTIQLSEEGMVIDLGGIAKGYAADKIAEYLESKDVNSAIINLGGNIFALGNKTTGEKWGIGVQNPFDSRGDYFAILKVSNKSIVTSGVYERFLEVDGKTYHHILSPFTGYPVDNKLMSVTIIADNSIDADGLSTTLFTLGIDKGMNLIESLNGVDAIFVNSDKKVFISSGIDSLQITNPEFKK